MDTTILITTFKEDISNRMHNFELRLNRLAKNIENLSKAINNFRAYSYQYNIKIVGLPQEKKIETAEESTKLCLEMFELTGADVAKWNNYMRTSTLHIVCHCVIRKDSNITPLSANLQEDWQKVKRWARKHGLKADFIFCTFFLRL